MVAGPIELLARLFEGDPSVRRVATDPLLSAELLLLFRMVLADGEVREEELATLRRICREAFGIADEDGFRGVMRHLRDYGYETTASQALAVLRGAPRERRVEMARHMAEIARSDEQLHHLEVRLLARTLAVLELAPHDIGLEGGGQPAQS